MEAMNDGVVCLPIDEHWVVKRVRCKALEERGQETGAAAREPAALRFPRPELVDAVGHTVADHAEDHKKKDYAEKCL